MVLRTSTGGPCTHRWPLRSSPIWNAIVRPAVALLSACAIASCREVTVPPDSVPPTGGAPPTSGASRVVWRVTTPMPDAGRGVAYDGTRVLVRTSAREITAFDPTNGRMLWRAAADEEAVTSPRGILVRDGLVVFGTGFALYAVEQGTGRRHWRWRPSRGGTVGMEQFLVADDSTLFVPVSLANPGVYRLSVRTGEEQWASFPAFGSPDQDTRTAEPLVTGDVVVVGTRIFVGRGTRGGIVLLDRRTGAEVWRFLFPAPLDPSVPEGAAYAGSFGGYAVVGDVVVATADNGEVFGLRARDGVAIWRLPKIAATLGDDRRVVAAGGHAVIGSDAGWVIAVDPRDGREVWRWGGETAGSPVFGPLTASGDVVYVVAGPAYALDAATGRLRWEHRTDWRRPNEGRLTCPLFAQAGVVVACALDGAYALAP